MCVCVCSLEIMNIIDVYDLSPDTSIYNCALLRINFCNLLVSVLTVITDTTRTEKSTATDGQPICIFFLFLSSMYLGNQTGNIATLDGASLKLVDKFTYLGSSVSSTEKDIDTRLTKAWTAIDRLSIIWKSDLTDKMKRSFFQAAVVSILLYGCTTWTLTKRLERRLDGNYTRMLRAVLNKSWRQHPTRLQLYGHLPPITKTIQVRRTRHAGHCWRSKDELISDVLLWTPTHGCARVGRPARTYIQQLCEDTGRNPEDLPEAMNDRERWGETVRDIRAGGAT